MDIQTHRINSSFFKNSSRPFLKIFRSGLKKHFHRNNHEKRVEDFYSTGINKKRLDLNKIEKFDRGFLSFGYWERDTQTYLDAATNLLDYIMENGKISKTNRILNVACGYGTETFILYSRLTPELIEGIEITRIHVDLANKKAKELGLTDRITFKYGDACDLNYPENYFSCIVGIEGPAHFNPRGKFLRAVKRVLASKGELLITDIILGKRFNRGKKIQLFLLKWVANIWVYPKVNWVDEQGYKDLLEKTGFKLIFLERLGNKVFPGFAGNCFNIKTIKTRWAHRGFFSILGLNIIAVLLGYVYKKGLIEYIFVKAQKPED